MGKKTSKRLPGLPAVVEIPPMHEEFLKRIGEIASAYEGRIPRDRQLALVARIVGQMIMLQDELTEKQALNIVALGIQDGSRSVVAWREEQRHKSPPRSLQN